MLRQVISRPSRTVGSAVRASAQSQILSRPQFYQTPLHAARAIAPQRATARWYSDEPAKDSEAKTNGDEAAKTSAEDLDLATIKKQLEAKDAEARDWKDKYLRSVADFRNLQERTTREMKAARDFAIQKFAKDLVDSVDNFDRALTMVPEEKLKAEEKTEHLQDLVNLYEGLKMTESIMLETLKKHGLERFDPNGESFNPNEHEATFMTPMPDKEHNSVFHTQQKGFKLNGRILRPAKVGVVKNK
ncbi:GrpE-domain-containing protein [Apodospora peruviana]|uniref:GrpE protein homolog n=1 Tax=Apodospora peruviana TaxID=516989 RepID=A0AAE0HZ78_9PEZI|nr:GrpE-domain-containing protein [Apodospora peruviana]